MVSRGRVAADAAEARANGGGIYTVRIGCDDAITDLGRWIPAGTPTVPLFGGGTRVVVPARDVGTGAPAAETVHLVDTSGAEPSRIAGVDAFGDDMAIFSGSARTGDGRFALVGDSQGIYKIPNRIAVVETTAQGVTARQVITPVEDPLSIVMSPFDDVALVVSGFGDAFLALDYAPSGTSPFALRGPITYTGARPELPGPAVMIERGALRGMVIVPENLGIRRLRFGSGAVITDLGKTATGASGFENITGSLGIQP